MSTAGTTPSAGTVRPAGTAAPNVPSPISNASPASTARPVVNLPPASTAPPAVTAQSATSASPASTVPPADSAPSTGTEKTSDVGAKVECDLNSAKLFKSARFSDVLIRFSHRSIPAHRFILCQRSTYFDKLCGPDSPYAEANSNEIRLHDDDPNAVEAMIRHLYNFWLKPINLSSTFKEKVRFYCNVIVVSDKYDLPALADEARKSLNTFVISLKLPAAVVRSLRIITEEYGNYKSLDNCAVNLATPRLQELATVPNFLNWLGTQPSFLQPIVEDAAKLRSLTTLPLQSYKPVKKYKCTTSGCKRVWVWTMDPSGGYPPFKCHGNPIAEDGVMHYE